LSAFTTSKGAVFGRAEIPEYKLRFGGSNADQIRNSLNGQGEIKIEEGRIALFDLVDTIQQRVKKMLTGETPAQGATNFTRFASRLVIQDRKIQMPELVLENPSLRVTGQGSIGFDRSLNFDLVANLSGDLASQLSSRLVGSNQAELHVPVRVRGTVDSPKVYPDVGRMVKERAVEKAKSLLDKLFQKQEEPKP
jgi:uncharacterized protein involved in outer membrane biogenesis